MNVVGALTRCPVLDHFPTEQLETLALCCTLAQYAAGATVLKEGEASHDAYLLATGAVRIERGTSYGTFELATLHEGSLFGETSLVDGGKRSVDAVAATDAQLLVLAPGALQAQSARDARFEMALWWAFWRSLSGKLRATNERLTGFFSAAGMQPPPSPKPREHTGSFRLQIGEKQDLFREQKLSRMEIHFLSSLSKERRLRPSEVLFREGDAGDAMYVVLDGRVRISKQIPGAGEEALAFLERGDWFGEMALIDDQPRSAEATAHDEGAVVLAIPRDVMAGLLDRRKVSSVRLLRILCSLVAKRLREVDDKLVGWFILSGGGQG